MYSPLHTARDHLAHPPPYRPLRHVAHPLTACPDGTWQVLTISGTNGMLDACEEGIGTLSDSDLHPSSRTAELTTSLSPSRASCAPRAAGAFGEGLMPEGGDRPRSFGQKPCFLMTARVHPGETPASHVIDGVLEFILRADDPRAAALRSLYVFKLVTMINPDGVARGHYRADTMGHNLNRCYGDAVLATQPSVYAIRALGAYSGVQPAPLHTASLKGRTFESHARSALAARPWCPPMLH